SAPASSWSPTRAAEPRPWRPSDGSASAAGLFEGVLVLRLFAAAVDRLELLLLRTNRGRHGNRALMAAEGKLFDPVEEVFGLRDPFGFGEWFARFFELSNAF